MLNLTTFLNIVWDIYNSQFCCLFYPAPGYLCNLGQVTSPLWTLFSSDWMRKLLTSNPRLKVLVMLIFCVSMIWLLHLPDCISPTSPTPLHTSHMLIKNNSWQFPEQFCPLSPTCMPLPLSQQIHTYLEYLTFQQAVLDFTLLNIICLSSEIRHYLIYASLVSTSFSALYSSYLFIFYLLFQTLRYFERKILALFCPS